MQLLWHNMTTTFTTPGFILHTKQIKTKKHFRPQSLCGHENPDYNFGIVTLFTILELQL